MEKFWMVSVDGGNAPTKRYDNLADAEREATRLAAKEGRQVFVLVAVEAVTYNPPFTWEKVV